MIMFTKSLFIFSRVSDNNIIYLIPIEFVEMFS